MTHKNQNLTIKSLTKGSDFYPHLSSFCPFLQNFTNLSKTFQSQNKQTQDPIRPGFKKRTHKGRLSKGRNPKIVYI